MKWLVRLIPPRCGSRLDIRAIVKIATQRAAVRRDFAAMIDAILKEKP